jgi:hypothetical protein
MLMLGQMQQAAAARAWSHQTAYLESSRATRSSASVTAARASAGTTRATNATCWRRGRFPLNLEEMAIAASKAAEQSQTVA